MSARLLLTLLLVAACGGLSTSDAPELGAELEGTCEARGVFPADGCDLPGCVLEVEPSGDGTAFVAVIVPAPESLGHDRVFCAGLYEWR